MNICLQIGGLDVAALAVLALASICQEVAFGGAGQDGFLSDGVKDSLVQQVLDVRATPRTPPLSYHGPVLRYITCLT